MMSWYRGLVTVDTCPSGPAVRRTLEDALDHGDAVREGVDFLGGVVHVEARPGAGGRVQHAVQGASAVVPGADGDALLVQQLGDVVGMNGAVFQVEGDHPGAGRSVVRAVESQL